MATCRDEHIDLRIVIIPELHKVASDYDFQKVHELVGGLAQEGDVPVIDLLLGVADQDVRSLWVSAGDPHPNERACNLFAEQLYTYLMSSAAKNQGSHARQSVSSSQSAIATPTQPEQ